MKKLAIIGGGAAGLAAAIQAAREARACDVAVVVYEADDRVGRSILATGNGRCNFSNAQVDASLYHNASFVRDALDALSAAAAGVALEMPAMAGETSLTAPAVAANPVQAFFHGLGLVWREEGEGRLYPLANKASVVLDVLRAAAARLGVVEACERRAVRLDVPERSGDRFHIRFADGVVEHADAVILATGGRAACSLLPPVIEALEMRPVLGPLRTDTAVVKHLNNIRVRAAVSLVDADDELKAREVGELLFRDYGVSGIAVFNLSRFAEPGDTLLIDLLPQVPDEQAVDFLNSRYQLLRAGEELLSGEELLRGVLLPAVAREVLRVAGLKPEAALGERDFLALATELKAFPLVVRGIGDERQCQVHRGGAQVSLFDAGTMEARTMPGLYVVGEALDVDAPCGGYNLHWAWASGMLAGRAAALRLAEGATRA